MVNKILYGGIGVDTMRQKVVSVLVVLGVLFSLFRCSGDEEKSVEKISTMHGEVEHEAIEDEKDDKTLYKKAPASKEKSLDKVGALSHDKTLYKKSAEAIAREKEEARLAALEAQREAQEEARRLKEQKERAEAEKLAAIKAKEEARLAAIKAKEAARLEKLQKEADEKLALKAKALRLTEEEVKVEEIKRENVEMVYSLEEAMRVISMEKETLEKEKEEMLGAQDALAMKIVDLETRLKEAEEKSKKLKIATAAATTLAAQQAFAKAQSEDSKKLEALQVACDADKKKLLEEKKALALENEKLENAQKNLLVKIEEWEKKAKNVKVVPTDEFTKLTEEKRALEAKLNEMNATVVSTKESLLAKINEWETKAKEAEAKADKLKAATAAAATLAAQQALAKAQAEDGEKLQQLESDLNKTKEEKLALENQIKAFDEEKSKLLAANNELNSSLSAKESDLESKMNEVKALEAKLNEMNTTVSSTKESLLAKINEWETKAKEAEAKADKLKAATAAAATLAAQQAMAKAQAEDGEKLQQLESDLNKTKEEKLALENQIKAFDEEKSKLLAANKELNSSLSASQEALEGCKSKSTQLQEQLKATEAKIGDLEAAKAKAQEAELAKAQAAQEEAQRRQQAEDELKSTLELNKVEFKYASSMLLGNSRELLDRVADVMLQHPEFTYEIQGHTDAHGNEDYNIRLSTQRAEAVKAYLIKKGVGEDILVATGFGSSMPIADNSTNEGRLLNRRVVIKIAE